MQLDPDKEKAILEEAIRLGQPIPDRFLNQPELLEFMRFYYDAFFELTTDRQIGFGEGPIPHSSIIAYCERLSMEFDEELDFIFFIRKMDEAYLKQRSKKTK